MSRMSQTQKDRRFDWEEGAGIVRRPKVEEATVRRNAGACWYCKEPVLASPGQRITYVTGSFGDQHPTHKKCRKKK